jgi:predicted acetyltransferase
MDAHMDGAACSQPYAIHFARDPRHADLLARVGTGRCRSVGDSWRFGVTIHIRAISEEELPTLLDETSAGFLNDRDVANDVHFSATMDLARTRCAFDGGEMVGTFGAFDFELAVPGATTRMAGTTIVTVRSTHRRKGLLREMMRAHFADARERSEPLAGLWASESGIYERFGYGAATDVMSLSIDPTRGEFSRALPEDGGCQLIGADEAAKVLPEIYDSLWRERPGLFARTESWWEHRRLIDDPKLREGASR